jgi:hypothetical protein
LHNGVSFLLDWLSPGIPGVSGSPGVRWSRYGKLKDPRGTPGETVEVRLVRFVLGLVLILIKIFWHKASLRLENIWSDYYRAIFFPESSAYMSQPDGMLYLY